MGLTRRDSGSRFFVPRSKCGAAHHEVARDLLLTSATWRLLTLNPSLHPEPESPEALKPQSPTPKAQKPELPTAAVWAERGGAPVHPAPHPATFAREFEGPLVILGLWV